MFLWWDRATRRTPFFTNPDFYPEGQTKDAVLYSIVAVGKIAGAKNVGIIYCAEAIQCQEGVAPLKQVAQKLGLPVPVALEISASAPNYTAACITAQQAHTTAIFVADAFPPVDKVASDCTKQGYHPIWVADGSGPGAVVREHPRWPLRQCDQCSLLCEHAGDTDHECRLRQVLPGLEKQPDLQRGSSLDVDLRSAVRGRGQGGRAGCQRQHAHVGPAGPGTELAEG